MSHPPQGAQARLGVGLAGMVPQGGFGKHYMARQPDQPGRLGERAEIGIQHRGNAALPRDLEGEGAAQRPPHIDQHGQHFADGVRVQTRVFTQV